jgi:hypothetical protein
MPQAICRHSAVALHAWHAFQGVNRNRLYNKDTNQCMATYSQAPPIAVADGFQSL